MPFTLAHPAAVLPLMRRPLDGLALACGAMAPDAPYFVRATGLEVSAQSWYEPFTNATTTHSLAGLPATLVAALVAYLLARAATRPAAWLTHDRWEAPTAADPAATARTTSRLGSQRRREWVPVSLTIGALTHLLWDSLTSKDGLVASRVEVLNEIAVADVTWTGLIGHASSIIGLIAVGLALWSRRRSPPGWRPCPSRAWSPTANAP